MDRDLLFMIRKLNQAIALLSSALFPVLGGSGISYGLSLQPEGAIAQTEECQTLITATNRAVGEIQTAVQTHSGEGGGPPLLAIAAATEQSIGHLQAITLTDPQLQGYQSQLIDLYTTTGQASRSLVAAVEQDDIAGARNAYATILRASSEEGPLVSDMQVYCGMNPS